MVLATRCDCDHFVPSSETARIIWAPPPGRKADAVRIEIKDRGGATVFVKTLDDPSVRNWEWDGEDQTPVPDVAKHYVNPLRSPFAVTVKAKLSDIAPPRSPPQDISSSNPSTMLPCGRVRKVQPARPLPRPPIEETGNVSVKVLYRQVTVAPMPWLDAYKAVSEQGNGDFPGGADSEVQRMWLQYRLNDLGYPAGPIEESTKDSLIRRGLFRYVQYHPDLPHIHHFDTMPSWTWEDEFEKEYGDLDEILAGTKPSGKKLLDALKASENGRTDVVETPTALSDRTGETRLILDHDIFYINKDFAKPDGHAAYDAELMSGATLPLKAKVLLVSKTDADGTGPGVDAPAAVGPAPIEWMAFDPPEDMSMVPTPKPANNRYRSQARRYLKKVLQDTATDLDDLLDSQDNCPAAQGGLRPSQYKEQSAYFEAIDRLCESETGNFGRVFWTKANVDETNPHRLLGLSGVFFTGSYIAGDDYVLQARLSFDNVVGGDAIKADHKALAGLKDSFGPAKRWMKGDPIDPVVEQTGHLTNWRRTHVAAELLWGPSTLDPINWFPIIDNFRAAHVILVPPKEGPVQLADFFDATTRDDIGQAVADGAIAANAGATKDELQLRHGEATVRRDAMYPVGLRTLVDFETSPRAKGLAPATPAARYAAYAEYVKAQGDTWPSYDAMVAVSLAIRKGIDKKKKGPGVVVIRARYMPTPDWTAILPQDVRDASTGPREAFAYTKAVATGMDYGLVFLDSINGEKYADIFFVTHEISHCMFGSHAFEDSSFGDHDRSDSNCIMFYNSKNDGLSVGWGARTIPDRFKLSVLLRRNAANNAGQAPPTYGRLDGAFVPKERGNTKEYSLTGTPAELQTALRGLKFKPDTSLDDGYLVDLELSGDGASVQPAVTPPLPYKPKVRIGDGTVKPFANIEVKPTDPRGVEPRFCGKCLLKLRGWRVRDPVGPRGFGSRPLAERAPAVPVNPTMAFLGYKITTGLYVTRSTNPESTVDLRDGATDPLDPRIKLGPYSFLHEHKLTWESSNGRMDDLATVKTREWVKFRTATQLSPFSEYADPDQEFVQYGSNGNLGSATDDHSIGWPALVVASNLAPGTIIGEQWYQYKAGDDGEWENIEGAAFLLEKTVYFNGKDWVLKFKKSNWAENNPKPFLFEVHYKIMSAPASQPKLVVNPHAGATPARPSRTGMADIMQSGARKADRSIGSKSDVTFEELMRKGYIASKPWK